MTRVVVQLVWLVVVWLALWERVSIATVGSGAVVAIAVTSLFPSPGRKAPTNFRARPALLFAAHTIGGVVRGAIEVAAVVLTPHHPRPVEAVLALPVPHAADPLLTILANAISLTPGTLTIAVRNDVLYVHVLRADDVEAKRRSLERLRRHATQAFGTAETIATLRAPSPGVHQ